MPGFPPAPPVLSADNQASLRSFLMGATTNYCIVAERLTGLGLPKVRRHDFVVGDVDGADGGDDDYEVHLITLPLEIATGNYATAMAALKLLLPVWAKSDTDLDLNMRLPGFGEFYYTGRPRGLDPDVSKMEYGIIQVDCVFEALDPNIHFI